MLIDTHCHLTDGRYTDIGEVLRKAFEAGVEKVIMPSTSVEDAKRAVEIAEREDQYCMVGIHPENVENLYRFRVKPGMTNGWSEIYPQGVSRRATPAERRVRNDDILTNAISELEKILRSSKRVVGIGEIGLDFFYDKEKKTKTQQIELFRKMMDLALANNLPVAIHMREAEKEMKEELDNFMRAHRDTPLQGQFHCFAGSEEFLKMILGMGYYVSFGGNITYKSAGSLRDLLKLVPRDRLLLETDSPYLPPELRRGTVNTPANVKITAEFVAQELGISFEEIAKTTSQNAICLYSLDI